MLTLKASRYTEKELRELSDIFQYLVDSVCDYCTYRNANTYCYHDCPYKHVIQDLQLLTKFNKK